MDLVHAPAAAPEALTLLASVIVVAACSLRFASRRFGAALVWLVIVAFALTGNLSIVVGAGVVTVLLLLRAGRGRPVRTNARDTLVQFGWIGFLFAAYTVARVPLEGGFDQAHTNAMTIIRLEQYFHLYFEPSIQEVFLKHESLMTALHFTYSELFLGVVTSSLLFLWCTDSKNFNLLRNSLGISAWLSLVIVAAVPTAPPRLVPESGILDSYGLFGMSHQFANEFAALPSNHVGWFAVSGFAVGRSVFGARGTLLGVLTGAVMLLTVIASGNHYWTDAAAGMAIAMIPAILIIRTGSPFPYLRRCSGVWTDRIAGGIAADAKWFIPALFLGGLLAWMLIKQAVAPGFTDFWAYLVFQGFATLGLLLLGERFLRKQGGLSWQTHVIAIICTYADVWGTAGDLYRDIGWYDKLTHFLGVAAVTSAAMDCLGGLRVRTGRRWYTERTVAIAVGITLGVCWEIYEWMGDAVFGTSRVQSSVDTARDLVFDTAGALVATSFRSSPSLSGVLSPSSHQQMASLVTSENSLAESSRAAPIRRGSSR